MDLDVSERAKRMLEIRGIYFTKDYSGWHARVVNGLEVRMIIKIYRELEENWDRLRVALCHLTDDQLKVALAYYRAYPDEIEQYIADEWAFEEEARRRGYPPIVLQPES